MKGSTFLLVLLTVISSHAQVAPHAMESRPAADPRGWTPVEVLKEAPSLKPTSAPAFPEIEFPVTTSNRDAQRLFNRGISSLHALAYGDAERCFREAAALDGDLAMAYWGMAMANLENAKRATAFIKEALVKKASASAREQRWIDVHAMLYIGTSAADAKRRDQHVQALEKLCFEFPEDVEAKAFLLFHLWNNVPRGLPAPSRFLVDSLAKQVLERKPSHHGVLQYVLGLWTPEHGEAAGRAAALALQKSPARIAHGWYEAGRVLEKLRDYPGAADCYDVALRIENQRLADQRLLPDASHLYPEALRARAWSLARAGRTKESVEFCKAALALPRPKTGGDRVARAAGDALLQILSEHELWAELAAVEPASLVRVTPREESLRLRMIASAAFRSGDAARGVALLRQLQIERMKIRTRRVEAADQAEEESRKRWLSPEDTAAAMAAAMRKHSEDVDVAEYSGAEVRMAQALAQGDTSKANLELAKIRDLRGMHEARLRFAAGDRATAVEIARQAARLPEVTPLMYANIADILWHGGEREEALQAFEKLRVMSAGADLSLPAFARLAPIVAELKLNSDWRAPIAQAKTAKRDSFGPASWQPAQAPSWQMLDFEGRPRTLEEFAGKPLVMLYYLGSGCVHCIEQLNAFAPVAKDFKAAGIEIVAVSTESADVLHKTWEQARQGVGFPFSILADPELKGFKAYRAFDEFKNEALHGTFLIDANGNVRWLNTGVEPFADPLALLEEAKRLLPGQKATGR